MGVDSLVWRVLASRTTCGRKLASGHEYVMCQVVASGHPKGRSAAKEPRSGLTRGSLLTPVPTSCGSSPPLFTTYARIYAADNIVRCIVICSPPTGHCKTDLARRAHRCSMPSRRCCTSAIAPRVPSRGSMRHYAPISTSTRAPLRAFSTCSVPGSICARGAGDGTLAIRSE